MKKYFQLITIFFLLAFSTLILANSPHEGVYRVEPGDYVIVDEHGECRIVSNREGRPATMAPTRHADEWEQFRIYRPEHIDLAECTYTVTYNANGGSCSPSSVIVSRGEGVEGPSCSRSGYDLTEFEIIDGDCTGNFDTNTGGCDKVKQDMEIKAYWQIACECASGPCCDGCNYRPSSHVCNTWTQYDYRCSSTACGGNVQRRSRDCRRYCSGSSSSCTGSTSCGSWSSWSTYRNCSSTEKCNLSQRRCDYALECDDSCSDCAAECTLGSASQTYNAGESFWVNNVGGCWNPQYTGDTVRRLCAGYYDPGGSWSGWTCQTYSCCPSSMHYEHRTASRNFWFTLYTKGTYQFWGWVENYACDGSTGGHAGYCLHSPMSRTIK